MKLSTGNKEGAHLLVRTPNCSCFYMPKKYQNRALLTKPSSSAPSTLKSSGQASAPGSHGAQQERSVNDLIRESRRAKGNDKHIETTVLSSLPPALRAVLDMPAPPPPPARTQLRGPARLRRIPGPPPPRSWLLDSQHAPENARDTFMQLRWLRARIQQQSSTLPGGRLPTRGSLEDMTLKAIAANWSWHAEYDHTYLATLPVRTRETLLSYLAIYDDAHWPNPFPLLFPAICDQDEVDEVTRLDLANSLGSWASLKKIEKELLLPWRAPTSNKDKPAEPVPESWEDTPSDSIILEPTLGPLRYTNLKHLSLALNPASSSTPPSWASLLSLAAAGLSTLKSLSLANWPMPTYTPNASKGRFKIQDTTAAGTRPQITYGGSDYYTLSDNNWREASGILRSLSRHLYCLTWLDLSGCGPWLAALTYTTSEEGALGPDWNGTWRNITHLNFSVGWLPGKPSGPSDSSGVSSSTGTSSIDSTKAIEHLYGDSEAIQHSLAQLAASRLGPRSPPDEARPAPWNVEEEREKQYFRRDVERYVAQRHQAGTVAEKIRTLRRQAGGAWIEFELGRRLDESEMRVE